MFGTGLSSNLSGRDHKRCIFKSSWSLKTSDTCLPCNLYGIMDICNKSLNSVSAVNPIKIQDGLLVGKIQGLFPKKLCKKIISELKNGEKEETGPKLEDLGIVQINSKNKTTLGKRTKKDENLKFNKKQKNSEEQETKINTISNEFQEMSHKYPKSIRSGYRLLLKDKKLTKIIWKEIKTPLNNLIKENPEIISYPKGFDILPIEDWELSGLNECIRVNRYAKGDKFQIHKDSQYCPNGNERSVFTLLIYLNSSYEGGSTRFYFPKNSKKNENLQFNDQTIQEEIDSLGGLDQFDQISTQKNTGDCLIMSQSILHDSEEILSNHTKWILKLDVIAKRKEDRICIHCKYPKGYSKEKSNRFLCNCTTFHPSSIEKQGYLQSLDYFRKAQWAELNKLTSKANYYYEKSLSIRYSFPKQEKNENQINQDIPYYVSQIPLEIWEIIFNFGGPFIASQLSKAFPSKLYFFKELWMRKYIKRTFKRNRFLKKNYNKKNLPDFIPKLKICNGIHHSMEFNSSFFKKNQSGCLRVAALYSFCLLSGFDLFSSSNKIYPVCFNELSNTVTCVPIFSLFETVFYGKQSYGAIYGISNDYNDNHMENFENSMDRNYLSLRHNCNFFGFNMDQISQSHTSKDDVEISAEGSFAEIEPCISQLYNIDNPTFYENLYDDSIFDDPPKDYFYLKHLHENYKQSQFNSKVGYASSLCSVDFNIEYFGEADEKSFTTKTSKFNNLVFDFERNQLDVEQLDFSQQCCLFQHQFIKYGICSSSVEKILSDTGFVGTRFIGNEEHDLFKVSIKPILSNGFSHASVRMESDGYQNILWNGEIFYKYTLVDHVHIYARSTPKKTTLEVIFGGILAL